MRVPRTCHNSGGRWRCTGYFEQVVTILERVGKQCSIKQNPCAKYTPYCLFGRVAANGSHGAPTTPTCPTTSPSRGSKRGRRH
ncbi:hypothetical protein CGRA01v4_12131 [Colletotrichum graminicola]|nr:hypothetical protein CGRA01v4_12131 [Colletotrichum graminicola]